MGLIEPQGEGVGEQVPDAAEDEADDEVVVPAHAAPPLRFLSRGVGLPRPDGNVRPLVSVPRAPVRRPWTKGGGAGSASLSPQPSTLSRRCQGESGGWRSNLWAQCLGGRGGMGLEWELEGASKLELGRWGRDWTMTWVPEVPWGVALE